MAAATPAPDDAWLNGVLPLPRSDDAGPWPAQQRQVPLDRMLLETDSPYLVPAGIKARRNEPANIPCIASKLAELLCVEVKDVADTTTRNAIDIFRLD